jgi:pimeloyl-ACP methyl ester carboxylesterase
VTADSGRPDTVPERFERPGVRWTSVPSAVLGERVWCWTSVPEGSGPFPVLHLLHGRGDSFTDALRLLDRMRAGEAAGRFPPHVVTAVDAPWSDRANWYVDSAHVHGRPVASALLNDVLPAVESALPVATGRGQRTVGGWSMGGAGALRLALLRPDLFGRVLALSPAVYGGLPPQKSNTRVYGAFGDGESLFSAERWHAAGYPKLLAERDRRHRLAVALAAGDAEVPGRPETELLHGAPRAPACRPPCACCRAGTTGGCGARRSTGRWNGSGQPIP